MRVFLAGATGVIGRRLGPMLLEAGHQVSGTTRSAAKAQSLRDAGLEPIVVDAFDRAALTAAVEAATPDAVIHQLTSLPQRLDPRKMERDLAANDRLRSEGTPNLVAAARAAGVKRIVAQSIAFAYAPTTPGTLHEERDPLYLDSPKAFQRTAHALAALEQSVLGAEGIVLRYGFLYGPGTMLAPTGSIVADIRRRRMPIVGAGAGVWSLLHVDDAALAAVQALDHDGPGVFNIVDDEPAPVSDWLPALAAAVGAPRPWRVPTVLARLAAGEYGTSTMTTAQGASNALAKRELDWQPRHPSWREGFPGALG
jgi:nucleoside-diphosphate-sugar epimerase